MSTLWDNDNVLLDDPPQAIVGQSAEFVLEVSLRPNLGLEAPVFATGDLDGKATIGQDGRGFHEGSFRGDFALASSTNRLAHRQLSGLSNADPMAT